MGSFVENVNKMASLTPTNVEDLSLIVQNIDAINQVAPLADDLNDIIDNVIPNLDEILQADNSATTATEQATIATTQAGIATTKAGEAEQFRNEAEAFSLSKAFVVDTIEALSTIPSSYTTAIVKDLNRGGTFIWSATGSANGGTVFAGVSGYWHRQYSGAVSVKWFGAVGDGITDDAAAFNNAYAVGGTLIIVNGNYLLQDDVTLGYCRFDNTAKLIIDNTFTVTLDDGIEANDSSFIFDDNGGSYAVSANCDLKEVYARWFGVEQNNITTDSSSALQKAIDFTQELGVTLYLPRKGRIRLDSQITFKHGNNGTTDTQSYIVNLDGNECMVYQNHNTVCFKVVPRCLYVDASTGRSASNITIKNINFEGYFVTLNNYTTAQAIVIGASSYSISPFSIGLIQDILIIDYLKPPIYITSSRHLLLDRVISRSCGIEIKQIGEGFTGDMTIQNSEFGGTNSKKPIDIYGYTASGIAEIRGIRFSDVVVYGSGTSIVASSGSKLMDMWFENCAWDGPNTPAGERAIKIFSNSGGSILQVYFDEPYIVNYSGDAIFAQSDDPGNLRDVRLNGGKISYIRGTQAIYLISVEGFSIANCDFSTNSGYDISVNVGCKHIMIQNNSSYSTGASHFVVIGGQDTNDFIITGNISVLPPVNDYSTAVNKLIANNLRSAT